MKKLGLALLLGGAFVAAAHVYQHCIADAAALFTGCDVCQSMAGASVNAQVTADPGLTALDARPEPAPLSASQAELPGPASRGPPLL